MREEEEPQEHQQVGGEPPNGGADMEVEASGQVVSEGMSLEELQNHGVTDLGAEDLPEAELGIAQFQGQGAQGQPFRDSL